MISTVERYGEHTIVTVAPMFDIVEVDELREFLDRELAQRPIDLTFDFGRCDFIDSSGLGLLVLMYKKCRAIERNMRLCTIYNARVREVFYLTRLDQIFNIDADNEQN